MLAGLRACGACFAWCLRTENFTFNSTTPPPPHPRRKTGLCYPTRSNTENTAIPKATHKAVIIPPPSSSFISHIKHLQTSHTSNSALISRGLHILSPTPPPSIIQLTSTANQPRPREQRKEKKEPWHQHPGTTHKNRPSCISHSESRDTFPPKDPHICLSSSQASDSRLKSPHLTPS